ATPTFKPKHISLAVRVRNAVCVLREFAATAVRSETRNEIREPKRGFSTTEAASGATVDGAGHNLRATELSAQLH
ncbi:MAG: hypothetical protein ACR2N1_17515, partial [Rubripirellula sp.]